MSKRHDVDDVLSPGAASLLKAAQRVHEPTAADRARMDAAIASKLTAAPSSAAKTLARSLLKLSVGIVCVAALALVFTRHTGVRSRPEPVNRLPVPVVRTIAEPTAATAHAELTEPAVFTSTEISTRERKPLRPIARRKLGPSVPATAPVVRPSSALASSAMTPRPSVGVTTVESSAREAPAITTARAPSEATTVGASAQPLSAGMPARRHADVAPPDDPDATRAELTLVARMHTALRKSDSSLALALSAEHERRWPHGVFEVEREAVRAIASCLARAGDAAPRAESFLTEHPRAPLAMRVRAACATQLASKRAP